MLKIEGNSFATATALSNLERGFLGKLLNKLFVNLRSYIGDIGLKSVEGGGRSGS